MVLYLDIMVMKLFGYGGGKEKINYGNFIPLAFAVLFAH
jgi:hypothetical protein